MLKCEHQFVALFFRGNGSPVGEALIEPDWGPARECAEFEALRAGRAASSDASVVPVWHESAGEPFVSGFRVRLEGDGEGELFGEEYFGEQRAQAVAQLVERGALRKGEGFRALTAAVARPRETTRGGGAPRLKLKADDNGAGAAPREALAASLTEASAAVGDGDPQDPPVFVPRHVLEEAAALSRGAGPVETGGILIGHLCRDRETGRLFAEVTAQIHARGAEAALTRLTFNASTWTDVRAAMALRRRGEIMLGWWHSHPLREWCKDCAPDRQTECSMRENFFSAHDRALHRAVFPKGYSVALVVNDLPDGRQTFSLFGWRRGRIVPRGFHAVDS